MEQENDMSDFEDEQESVSEEEVVDELDDEGDEQVVEEDEVVDEIDDGEEEEDIDIQGEEETKNQNNDKIQNVYDNESDYSVEISDDDTSEEEDDEEEYNLEHKFDYSEKNEYIKTTHPQILQDTYNDINVLSNVERDSDNNIIDENHRTIPILTKYEKTRILGIRISQLNNGAKPYVNIENTIIIDNNIIAEKELLEKKIPIIIMRPLPNGKKEYWKLSDLEIITY